MEDFFDDDFDDDFGDDFNDANDYKSETQNRLEELLSNPPSSESTRIKVESNKNSNVKKNNSMDVIHRDSSKIKERPRSADSVQSSLSNSPSISKIPKPRLNIPMSDYEDNKKSDIKNDKYHAVKSTRSTKSIKPIKSTRSSKSNTSKSSNDLSIKLNDSPTSDKINHHDSTHTPNASKMENNFPISKPSSSKTNKHRSKPSSLSSRRAIYSRSTDGELNTLRKKMDIYQRENRALRDKLQSLSFGVDKITQLDNLVAEKDATIQQLKKENKTLQKVMRTQEKELAKPNGRDEDIGHLVNEIKALTSNYRNAQKRLNELRERNHEILAHNEDLKSANNAFRKVLEVHNIDVDVPLKQTETVDVYARIKTLEKHIGELSKTVENRNAKIYALEKAKVSVEDRLKGELNIMYEKIAEKDLEITTLQAQLQEAVRESRNHTPALTRHSPLKKVNIQKEIKSEKKNKEEEQHVNLKIDLEKKHLKNKDIEKKISKETDAKDSDGEIEKSKGKKRRQSRDKGKHKEKKSARQHKSARRKSKSNEIECEEEEANLKNKQDNLIDSAHSDLVVDKTFLTNGDIPSIEEDSDHKNIKITVSTPLTSKNSTNVDTIIDSIDIPILEKETPGKISIDQQSVVSNNDIDTHENSEKFLEVPEFGDIDNEANLMYNASMPSEEKEKQNKVDLINEEIIDSTDFDNVELETVEKQNVEETEISNSFNKPPLPILSAKSNQSNTRIGSSNSSHDFRKVSNVNSTDNGFMRENGFKRENNNDSNQITADVANHYSDGFSDNLFGDNDLFGQSNSNSLFGNEISDNKISVSRANRFGSMDSETTTGNKEKKINSLFSSDDNNVGSLFGNSHSDGLFTSQPEKPPNDSSSSNLFNTDVNSLFNDDLQTNTLQKETPEKTAEKNGNSNFEGVSNNILGDLFSDSTNDNSNTSKISNNSNNLVLEPLDDIISTTSKKSMSKIDNKSDFGSLFGESNDDFFSGFDNKKISAGSNNKGFLDDISIKKTSNNGNNLFGNDGLDDFFM
eukprot:TRINITY_DN77_c0_g1_i1.p1 TRINITY_DN77_c0_g1~~TRINITY_DN77_c0_g1_i1.p1  ORF type:complete len:1025 (+),score=351.41 TRINITY_DN77_c0_g1_i1:110-3184(+)